MFNALVSSILSEITVLEEGILSLPRRIYQDIVDYYTEMYKKAKVKDIKRTTPDTFPTKRFKLDLSGTKFEFMNKLNPEVEVVFGLDNQAYFSSRYMMRRSSLGLIYLGLKTNYSRMIYDIIEHELLHYIQYLYSIYQQRDGKLNIGSFEKIAGLPPKKLLDPRKDIHGRIKGSDKFFNKRTKHSHRPIEYYPDLLSSLRELQFLFLDELKTNTEEYDKLKIERPISKLSDRQKEIDEKNTLEKQKNYFFKKFLNRQIKRGIATHVFDNFKTLSPEIEKITKKKKSKKKIVNKNLNKSFKDGKRKITFYEHMIKLLYDGFMNRDRNFDEKYIEDKLKEINDLYEAEQSKKTPKETKLEDKFTFDKQKLQLDSYDAVDIIQSVSKTTSDELDKTGSTIANSQDVLEYFLGIRRSTNKDYDTEVFKFPSKIDSVKTLLKKVKNLDKTKVAQQYEVSEEAGEDITKQIIKYFFDLYTENLRIAKNGTIWYPSEQTKNEFKEFLNSI